MNNNNNNNLFKLGQPVGIYQFTSLAFSNQSLSEKTMVFDGKTVFAGRILGTEERYTSKSEAEVYLLIVTINGIIFCARKKDIFIDSHNEIETFLQTKEFQSILANKEPYDGKIVRKADGNWYIRV